MGYKKYTILHSNVWFFQSILDWSICMCFWLHNQIPARNHYPQGISTIYHQMGGILVNICVKNLCGSFGGIFVDHLFEKHVWIIYVKILCGSFGRRVQSLALASSSARLCFKISPNYDHSDVIYFILSRLFWLGKVS